MQISGGIAASAADATINKQIVCAGQSWMTLLRTTDMHQGLVQTLVDRSLGPVIYLNIGEYGGSAMLEENAHPDTPTNYWVSGDVGSFTDGPRLTTFLALLATRPTTPTPIGLVFYQVHADTLFITAGDNTEANKYKQATIYCMNRIAAFWNAGSPGSVKKYMDIEGRRKVLTNPKATTFMRDTKLDLISANSSVMRAALDMYDLPLPATDDVHPSARTAWHMGFRTAMAIDNDLFSGTWKLGPTVTGVTRGASNRLDVAINVESGMSLVKPAAPLGFKVFAGSSYVSGAEIPITGYAWSGNTLRLTLASAGQATLCYPWENLPGFSWLDDEADPGTIIRYSTKQHARDIGMPLRTMRSVTVAA